MRARPGGAAPASRPSAALPCRARGARGPWARGGAAPTSRSSAALPSPVARRGLGTSPRVPAAVRLAPFGAPGPGWRQNLALHPGRVPPLLARRRLRIRAVPPPPPEGLGARPRVRGSGSGASCVSCIPLGPRGRGARARGTPHRRNATNRLREPAAACPTARALGSTEQASCFEFHAARRGRPEPFGTPRAAPSTVPRRPNALRSAAVSAPARAGVARPRMRGQRSVSKVPSPTGCNLGTRTCPPPEAAPAGLGATFDPTGPRTPPRLCVRGPAASSSTCIWPPEPTARLRTLRPDGCTLPRRLSRSPHPLFLWRENLAEGFVRKVLMRSQHSTAPRRARVGAPLRSGWYNRVTLRWDPLPRRRAAYAAPGQHADATRCPIFSGARRRSPRARRRTGKKTFPAAEGIRGAGFLGAKSCLPYPSLPSSPHPLPHRTLSAATPPPQKKKERKKPKEKTPTNPRPTTEPTPPHDPPLPTWTQRNLCGTLAALAAFWSQKRKGKVIASMYVIARQDSVGGWTVSLKTPPCHTWGGRGACYEPPADASIRHWLWPACVLIVLRARVNAARHTPPSPVGRAPTRAPWAPVDALR